MRSRNIKPGFFKNEFLSELPFESRLLFAGLWCMADREGRLEFRPKRIHAEIFPYNPEIQCSDMIQILCDSGFLRRYSVNGIPYLDIPHFLRHQNPHKNEKPSAIPEYENRDIDTENSDSGTSTVQAPYKHRTSTVQVGLIPDSLIPDSLIPDNSANAEIVSFAAWESSLFESWNSLPESIPRLRQITSKRRRHLKCRYSESEFRDRIPEIMAAIKASDFLTGKNDRGWRISFDWLIENDTNYIKILEGRYGAKQPTGDPNLGKRNYVPQADDYEEIARGLKERGLL